MRHHFIHGMFSVLLGALFGLAASCFGGELAMARGAVLGGCIVAACCVVDMLGLKRFQLLLSCVIGGLFGLLAGGAILWFKLNQGGNYDLVQLGDSTLLACAAYGAMANLAFRWAFNKGCGFLASAGMVYMSLVLVHVLRMWALFSFIYPGHVLIGAVFNCVPFALAVAWPMCRQLRVKKAAMTFRGFVVGAAVMLVLYVCGDIFLSPVVVEYRDACFCAANYHPEMLSGMAGKIYYSSEACYVFGHGGAEWSLADKWSRSFDVGGGLMAVQDGSGVSLYSLDKHELLSQHDFGDVNAVALSPDGSKLAVANWGRKHISVVDTRAPGGTIWMPAPADSGVNGKPCWTKGSASLVLADVEGWLVEIAVPSGNMRRLVRGSYPRLVADTGEIVFIQDWQLCSLDLGNLAVRRLDVPAEFIPYCRVFGGVFDVSPCGKFLTFIRKGYSYRSLPEIVLVAEAKKGGRMHVLMQVPRSSMCGLRWTK